MTYNLPSNLKKMISISNINQANFGKLIGNSSPATVSGWVSGSTKPPIDKILLMCSHFNVSLSEFVTGEIGFPSKQYDDFVAENHPHLLSDTEKEKYGVDKDQIIVLLQDKIKLLEENLPKLMEITFSETIGKIDEMYIIMQKNAIKENLAKGVEELNDSKNLRGKN